MVWVVLFSHMQKGIGVEEVGQLVVVGVDLSAGEI
jgi:hypothetical protein